MGPRLGIDAESGSSSFAGVLGRGSAAGRWLAALATALSVTGCQAGIGPDQERPRATIDAYGTRVGELERRVGEQEATLASLTPPPATPTPIPLTVRWRIEPNGAPELRRTVGQGDGLTPVSARAQFLIVPVSVTNLRSTPAVFSASDSLAVVDEQGRRYDLDPRASDATYLLDLGLDPAFGARQPGIAYPDVFVFDVPEGATSFGLVSADGSLEIELGSPTLGTPSP